MYTCICIVYNFIIFQEKVKRKYRIGNVLDTRIRKNNVTQEKHRVGEK